MGQDTGRIRRVQRALCDIVKDYGHEFVAYIPCDALKPITASFRRPILPPTNAFLFTLYFKNFRKYHFLRGPTLATKHEAYDYDDRIVKNRSLAFGPVVYALQRNKVIHSNNEFFLFRNFVLTLEVDATKGLAFTRLTIYPETISKNQWHHFKSYSHFVHKYTNPGAYP